MTAPLVEAKDLVRNFRVGGWRPGGVPQVSAVAGVSFVIAPGETLALVGESGSGKSTVGRLILGLDRPTSGTVHFDGHDLGTLPPRELRRLRRRMQVMFQDPHGSLNPRRSVGASIAEGIAIHDLAPASERKHRVAEVMAEVGLDPGLASRLPNRFSGGQRQRIGIARALAVSPDFIVCDEPVSSLDVSIQAQIINLLLDLRERRNLAYLFIAHDLALVQQVAHRVAVMYLGTIVETGPARAVIDAPSHPYTRALVSAVPSPDPGKQSQRIVLTGEPASAVAPPSGCPFEPRCFHPAKDARCRAERPSLRPSGNRSVACHHEEGSGADGA